MFNVEKYIATCIDSILSQTFQDFELIVIDDCSADRSFEIVASYDDPRIHLFQNIIHSERSFSRNFGIQVARGEFIYFMDSDDAILPKALETLVAAIEESEVILMNSFLENREGVLQYKYCKDPDPRILSADIKERIRKEYLTRNVEVTPWIRFQRRDFLFKNEIYFPLITRKEDVLFNLAEICLAKKIRVIDGCCYIWRVNRESTTRTIPEISLREVFRSLPEAIQFINRVIQATEISETDKIEIKSEIEFVTIKGYFNLHLRGAYGGRLKIGEIDSILNELLRDHKLSDPNVIRVLFNTLAKELIRK